MLCSLHKKTTLIHLKVHVDVISQDVHPEELSAADLAGVFFIPVGQQVFVHVTPTGKHLEREDIHDCVIVVVRRCSNASTTSVTNQIAGCHLATDGTC